MTSPIDFQNDLKKGIVKNCYVFCGPDELLIKEAIQSIIDKTVNKDFKTLNCIRFDGDKVDFDTIMNTCETVPFMSDKKVVIVYRSSFLEDNKFIKHNTQNEKGEYIFKKLFDYIDDIPSHCILIMYYVFSPDRNKSSSKFKRLGKKACAVEFKKLWGNNLERKVRSFFKDEGKEIGKVELALFCSLVNNNLDIIKNEVQKLCSYTEGRDITSEDINILLPQKSDNDIFNLVDSLSQKNPKRALDVLNELLYKGENIFNILAMIERQYNILLNIKLSLNDGKNKNEISSELKLHPFVCEKMISQSNKFSLEQLQKYIELCLITEKRLKSSSIDKKTEMELLIINSVRI